ncbi:hypothetical protein H0H81_008600 [Sphagnurus paluster]|uniref:Thioester reductase (TE) domain-containing protein n=1 Tax=Sphagnurus paluster TaxID=117069 RepID=A0A9P7K326_9AGAR|nr:hypothetical protein H0H81_008600 [Sphagnurus paluster]
MHCTPYQPSDASKPYDQIAHMEYLIDHYSRPSWASLSAHDDQQPRPTSILLTGSTGNLGSYILALLIADPNVARIYALNRSSPKGPAFERVAAQFQKKGLDVAALRSEKVSFIEGDTTKSDLGLNNASLYNEIRDTITIILHNAWPINLRNDLTYFEPQILGLKNLIDLGHASPHASTLRFVFISSFQAYQSWHMHHNALLPEQPINETAVGCGIGYGASKYVAESVRDSALAPTILLGQSQILARSGLNTTAMRLTQLCGTTRADYWSPFEWIPILMSAGVQVGVLPDVAGLMAFVPMDDAAKCVHEIVSCKQVLPAAINVSHPRPISWNILFETINNVLKEQRNLDPLPTMPFSKWLLFLRDSAYLAKIRHPSLMLIPGTRGMAISNDDIVRRGRQDVDHFPKPHLSIDAAETYSSSLRDLKEITPEGVRGWVEYVISMIPNL